LLGDAGEVCAFTNTSSLGDKRQDEVSDEKGGGFLYFASKFLRDVLGFEVCHGAQIIQSSNVRS
jgi:hypothetical protein